MDKTQKGKLLEQLDAMSKALEKGEKIKSDDALRDDELDIVSGGKGFNQDKIQSSTIILDVGPNR